MTFQAPPTPRRRVIAARSAAAAALLLPIGLLMGATSNDADPDALVMATAHWQNRAQLQKIAGHFQHLIIDEKAHTARIEASSDDLAKLRRIGVRVEIDGEATDRMRRAEALMVKRADIVRRELGTDGQLSFSGLAKSKLTAEESIPGYACYRTVEETYATMNQLAATNPSLASVVDIGPSWAWADSNGSAGYRMRVLRLNNTATDASVPNKPNMVVLAAIHAREYTTAELTTRFAEWLVRGHGTDREATWLLDNFRFHFLLQANPDGRKRAESGLSWRKNTNTDNGACSANAYGVDLNRNFSWRFNTVAGGSSGDPCDATYRGPGAVSENEAANAMRYIVGTPGSGGTYSGGVLADRRTDAGTAPTDYRGMFLDIHSFSQLVLWPWAYTSADAPNAPALQTLGRRLAYFNNYRPVQWTGLYAADGTNTDTVYGISGAPSYTIELGQEFFEACSTFESSTYPRNLNALKYAARNLQQPYVSPGGPDSMLLAASAGSVVRGQAFAVSGWIDDSRYNQSNGTEGVQNIASATAWLDRAPWLSGATPLAMRASDGAFNSPRELAVVNIDTHNLAIGRHVVYLRGTDASGTAGTPSAYYFTVRGEHEDFDGDTRGDLVWRNGSTGANSIWRSANSAAAVPLASMATNAQVAAQGDFNGDGRTDLFWRNASNGTNGIWLTGNKATPQAVSTVTGGSWRVVGAGDFDGDGRTDVFWRNVSDGRNAIWRAANSASQIPTPPAPLSWQVVGIGDFDKDGLADVVWRNVQTGQNAIWHAGSGVTQQAVTAVNNLSWKIVGVGDFDGNGTDDLLWRNASNGTNTIWRNANNATQQAVTTVPTSWRVVDIADYDGDRVDDILWRNMSTGANSLWRRANSATPLPVTAINNLAWSVVPYENQP